jgi:putative PIN family toxin of toxin-antitoxin system
MPRVVLDSSVLISAFVAPHGEVMPLLREPLKSRYHAVLSMNILEETTQKLLTKPALRRYASYRDDDVHAYVAWLLSQAELVDGELPELHVVLDDPKDDMVVATAVAAQAQYLVSGDRHLLSLGRYEGIAIISVRQFLDMLGDEHEAQAT